MRRRGQMCWPMHPHDKLRKKLKNIVVWPQNHWIETQIQRAPRKNKTYPVQNVKVIACFPANCLPPGLYDAAKLQAEKAADASTTPPSGEGSGDRFPSPWYRKKVSTQSDLSDHMNALHMDDELHDDDVMFHAASAFDADFDDIIHTGRGQAMNDTDYIESSANKHTHINPWTKAKKVLLQLDNQFKTRFWMNYPTFQKALTTAHQDTQDGMQEENMPGGANGFTNLQESDSKPRFPQVEDDPNRRGQIRAREEGAVAAGSQSKKVKPEPAATGKDPDANIATVANPYML